MGFVIGVVGASGGVGASTLTAALAVRARTVLGDERDVLAIDLDVRGGLDVTLCMEHIEGQRWTDSSEGRWSEHDLARPPWLLLGEQVRLSELPREDGVALLAAPPGWDPARNWHSVVATLDDLAQQTSLVVIDCGARPPTALLSRLDLLVIVFGLSPKGLGDLRALQQAGALERTQPLLVSRGAKGYRSSGPMSARQVGLPFLAHLAEDPRVPRHASEGIAPGRLRSAVDAVADEVLAMADASWVHTLMSQSIPVSASVFEPGYEPDPVPDVVPSPRPDLVERST